jgi:hypothetical protein
MDADRGYIGADTDGSVSMRTHACAASSGRRGHTLASAPRPRVGVDVRPHPHRHAGEGEGVRA